MRIPSGRLLQINASHCLPGDIGLRRQRLRRRTRETNILFIYADDQPYASGCYPEAPDWVGPRI